MRTAAGLDGFEGGLPGRERLGRAETRPGASHVSGLRSLYPGHTMPASRQRVQTGRVPSQTQWRRWHSQHGAAAAGSGVGVLLGEVDVVDDMAGPVEMRSARRQYLSRCSTRRGALMCRVLCSASEHGANRRCCPACRLQLHKPSSGQGWAGQGSSCASSVYLLTIGSSSRRSRVAQASIEVGERVVAGPWSVLSQSRSQAEAAQDEAASQARGGKYSPSEPSGVRGGTKDDDDRRQNRAGPGRGPNKLCEGRWPASSSCTVSPARATTNTWRGGPMRDDFGPGTGGLQTQWRPGLRPGSLEATRRLQAASLMGVCRRSAMPTGMSSAAPMPAAPGDERRATACGKDAKRDEARRDETIPVREE